MRRIALLATTLFALACGRDATAPTPTFQGTWAEVVTLPGSGLVMHLAQQGSAITGTGTYTVEAGGSGTFQVSGTATGTSVALTITFDVNADATFTGTLVDATHLSGTYASGPAMSTVSFTRQ